VAGARAGRRSDEPRAAAPVGDHEPELARAEIQQHARDRADVARLGRLDQDDDERRERRRRRLARRIGRRGGARGGEPASSVQGSEPPFARAARPVRDRRYCFAPPIVPFTLPYWSP